MPALIDELWSDPTRFEFFQAVRIIDQWAREARGETPRDNEPLLGHDVAPGNEAVHFRAAVSASFPSAGIQAITQPRADGTGRVDMTVNFMGLTGPNGVLPHHFTSLLIDRHRANDPCLAAFQDVFNHRLIALFYRAWEKYRFGVTYERRRRLGHSVLEDRFTRCLLSLAGLGTPALTHRQHVADEAYVYYGGHFAHHPRNAVGLQALLADYFRTPADVTQFTGQWFELAADDYSLLPTKKRRRGQNAGLGTTLTVGTRVFLVASRFRVTLGPLTFKQYLGLLPDGSGHAPFRELTKMYAGPEQDFDLQLVLKAAEVPPCRLGGEQGSRLGWTSFLHAAPVARDTRGAAFAFLDI